MENFFYGVGAGGENPVPARIEPGGVGYVELRLKFREPLDSRGVVLCYALVLLVGDVVGGPREGVDRRNVFAQALGHHLCDGEVFVVRVRQALAFCVG